MRYEVGIDIGGTFTDFVAYDYKTHNLHSEKVLTTPDRPSDAVIQGLLNLESKAGVKLSEIGKLLHATTLATNALIERKGALTGLITTSGFEDVLDIRKGLRYNQYDLKIQIPKAYVPRFLRRGLTERIFASGQIAKEISESELIENVRELVHHGISSLAICFLHSYANPTHEIKAREIVTKNFPRLAVSISSDITSQAREYERMSTTVVNAYVKPIVDRYVGEITERLEELGFGGKLLIMTCSGGVVDPSLARKVPVLLLESGPVAGVAISSEIGKRLRTNGVFSFDMGGTTAKGSIVAGRRIEKNYEFEAARVDKFRRGSGIPISIPTVRLVEIGSGGGGIARVDKLGIIRVGPESAGARPGPACYDLGGVEPTVTDSNLVLGYLDAEFFLGGKIKLNIDLAKSSINSSISEKMGLSVEAAAWAIHERANEDIASAFRLHASEIGVDYRNYSFVSFGGAGPVHAARIAKKLFTRKVVVPPRAGVLSAEGLLSSPLSIDIARTMRHELSDLSYQVYHDVFMEIVEGGIFSLTSSGLKENELRITRGLDMCYHGQGFQVPVELRSAKPSEAEFSNLKKSFEMVYKSRYSISGLSNEIDITSFKVTISGPPALCRRFRSKNENEGLQSLMIPRKRKTAFDSGSMRSRNFTVTSRYSLKRGDELDGPVLIQEVESTTVVPSGCKAEVDQLGNIILSLG